MKTIALPKTALIPAAIFAAATIGLSGGVLAAAADDIASDAAHSLAYKFALEEQKAAEAKQLGADREAAQRAAEKAAMEAAQRAAKAARAEAELKAYRDDLLQRATREAAGRRKSDEKLRKSELAKKLAREKSRKKAKAARAKAAADAKARANARAKRLEDQRLAEMRQARDRELNLLDLKLQRLQERQAARKQAKRSAARRRAEADKQLAAAQAADAQVAEKRRAELRRKRKASQLAEQRARQDRRAAQARAAKRLAAKQRSRERLAQQRAEQDWLREQRLAQQRFAAEERLAELRRARQRDGNAATHRRQLDRAIAAAEKSVASRTGRGRIAEYDRSLETRPPAWTNGDTMNRNSDSSSNRNEAPAWMNKPAAGQTDALPSQPAYASGHHATILLVMKPGNRGIRRFNKTADPVLCTRSGCYISQGPDSAARFVSRRHALGMRNTLGRRAGACNQRLGCIFRNVDLSDRAVILQPVDLRMLHHDRRRAQLVKAPKSCSISGRLQDCCETYRARDYVMLVVPEAVAAGVSSEALQDLLGNAMMNRDPRASFNTSAGVPRYN